MTCDAANVHSADNVNTPLTVNPSRGRPGSPRVAVPVGKAAIRAKKQGTIVGSPLNHKTLTVSTVERNL
jgi:hypothetical protein